ncbi:Glycosyltransferase involved in cell wall bisynthesis [Cyclonatronum proteinivorum]|uniref:Glycosyltransferase involved in cell wall bisynthesis n=1 Tax=Cyclonatronum proteinivorum TaxID=1457365 RepID=A0A345UIK3_9BACT|nr:glycosyltransferase family 1 protein [Cyclonatronum proteinivorum]AXJ00305.1 Glycosyltransferase involved in cell wall bisynthesis [Cyclonatronum proteinivorum]
MTKRVAIEAQRIFRPKKHGMDMVALETVRQLIELQPEGYEFFVFVKPDDDVCVTSSGCVNVIELPATTYPYWEQIALPAALNRYKVDLLHTTSNTAPVSPVVPLIITLHDIIYLEKGGVKGATWYQKLGTVYRKWNVPRVVPKAKALITVSEFEKKRIQQHFGEKTNVHVVYNGISDRFFAETTATEKEAVKARYKLPDQFVFFLGNTDPKKNLPNVLKAALRILREGPENLKMVIADYAPERLEQMLKAHQAEELASRFVLPGYIKNTDLPAIYASCALFLYPSLRESFGIPIIEAQACGAPLITSNTSSMPEVSGSKAVLVDPADFNDIADKALEVLHNDDFRLKLISDGKQNAARFSWKQTALGTLKLYSDILNR